MSIITDYVDKLRKIEAQLDDIEENCDKDYAEAVDALDNLKEKAEEYAEPIWDYEEYLFNSDLHCTPKSMSKLKEAQEAKKLTNRILKRIKSLCYEITGYDEHEVMQMMYPNDDIDSEDFEDGFDLEDFYEED